MSSDIFSIIQDGDGVEASVSLWRDVIGSMLSTATGVNHHEDVVIRQLHWSNRWIYAFDDPALGITSSETDWEMKSEAEEMKLHSMAKVQNILEIWQGSQNLHATQKESPAQNKQITAIDYTGYWKDFQSISVKLLIRKSCCIYIVGKITLAIIFGCIGQLWRTNSSNKCPPNRKIQLQSKRMW